MSQKHVSQKTTASKKKPCLDDRDTDSPLDKDRDTILPGPEERSSRPGQEQTYKTSKLLVFVFNFIFISYF